MHCRIMSPGRPACWMDVRLLPTALTTSDTGSGAALRVYSTKLAAVSVITSYTRKVLYLADTQGSVTAGKTQAEKRACLGSFAAQPGVRRRAVRQAPLSHFCVRFRLLAAGHVCSHTQEGTQSAEQPWQQRKVLVRHLSPRPPPEQAQKQLAQLCLAQVNQCFLQLH